MAKSLTATSTERETLAGLLDNLGYEIMPFKSVQEKVIAQVPKSVPLTVTATGGKGLEPTLETAIALHKAGYQIAPHLPARLIASHEELDQIVSRLEQAEIERIFVVAGDAESQAGEFNDSVDMLKALDDRGHHFTDVGVGGYPEGHSLFETSDIENALVKKAPYATRLLTQICFDPDRFLEWGGNLHDLGVELPIYAGMPGPVSRQKLLRISAGLGLGQSANFLKKQQNMFWRFFSPTGYKPTKLIQGFVRNLAASRANIVGMHIFTFNDFGPTEAWRNELLMELG